MTGELSKYVKQGKVFVFSGSYCPYCKTAKESLTNMGIDYEYLETDLNPLSDDDSKKLDKICGFDTIPKIFVGLMCIGGNSDLQELIQSGEIYQILEDEGISFNKLS